METALQDMSREELLNKSTQLQDELTRVIAFREDLILQSNRLQNSFNKMKEDLKNFTLLSLKEETINDEQAMELATIGNFHLSQNYDVTMTVEHTFTVCVEAGEDIDDILNTIDFNVTSYSVDLMNEDSNVVDTNYDPVDY